MAETKDTHHIIEIPVDKEHHQHHQNNNKILSCSNMFEAIDDHPLTEISESPGHLLLLKLLQREENLFAKRISTKESRIDSIKSQLFQLTSFFFIFHFFFLTLLFTSWAKTQMGTGPNCRIWWIPSLISLCTSLVFVFLIQVKLHCYWKIWEGLQREKSDSRGVGRCIQELRMKGASFDLSKECLSNGTKTMKSSSVEIKWKVVSLFWNYLLTVCLVCFAGLVFPVSKFILCGL